MCASSMAAYCSTNGGTEVQYQIARDDGGDSSRNVHLYAWLIDYAANAAKVWYFQTDTTQFYSGLQTSLYGAKPTQAQIPNCSIKTSLGRRPLPL